MKTPAGTLAGVFVRVSTVLTGRPVRFSPGRLARTV